MRRLGTFVLLLALLGSSAALADIYQLVAPTHQIDWAAPAGSWAIERTSDTGGPVSTAAPALTATVSTDSPLGGFSAAGQTAFSKTLTTTFSQGASRSTPFSYADTRVGLTRISADAGAAAFIPAALFDVGPLGFVDTFDNGAATPRWSEATFDDPDVTLTLSSDAAHRGAQGFQIVDAASASGKGTGTYLRRRLIPASPDVYLRFWVRLRQSNQTGAINIVNLQGDGPFSTPMLTVSLFYPGPVVRLEGYAVPPGGGAATNARVEIGSTLADGQWHLLELAAVGVDSNAGARKAWVDGALVGNQNGLDWRGARVTSVTVGLPFIDDWRFAGTLDVDDFRMGARPHSSRLALRAPRTAPAHSCAPVEVSLNTADGEAVRAPESVNVELLVDGGTTFSDARCLQPVTTVTLAKGDEAGVAYLTAPAGAAVALGVAHPDHLRPVDATVTFESDEQSAPVDPCGCSAGSFGPLAAALAAVAARLRRQRAGRRLK